MTNVVVDNTLSADSSKYSMFSKIAKAINPFVEFTEF